jgi:hypothetical protein
VLAAGGAGVRSTPSAAEQVGSIQGVSARAAARGRIESARAAERNYTGGYSILTDWRPRRIAMRVVAVRRFETPPGKQAQVDWGHLGSLEMTGHTRRLWGFTFTLGHSRSMMAAAALEQKLGQLMRMHEEAFYQMGGASLDDDRHFQKHRMPDDLRKCSFLKQSRSSSE